MTELYTEFVTVTIRIPSLESYTITEKEQIPIVPPTRLHKENNTNYPSDKKPL